MSLESTDEDLITEFLILTRDTKLRLFVESETDVNFYKTHLWDKKIDFYDRSGWEGVNNFLIQWNDELKKINSSNCSVFGIIDKDYHDYSKNNIAENIIKTDFRDLEIIFFESDEVLRKLVNEFFSKNKTPKDKYSNADLNSIREQIYGIACFIGRLRLGNHVTKKGIAFTKENESHYDFSKFVEKNLTYNINKLINHISANNRIAKEEILALFQNYPENSCESKYLCNGHDVIFLLGYSLRNKFGNVDAKMASIEYLEPFIRNSFPTSDFFSTNLAKTILRKLEEFENSKNTLQAAS